MKRLLFTCVLALFATFAASAQGVSSFLNDKKHTVIVSRKGELIPLGSVLTDKAKENISIGFDKWALSPINATNRPIKLKKDAELVVIGFVRSVLNSSTYDYYIVDYNDDWCFLDSKFCLDNSLIENQNFQVKEYYEQLKDKAISLANQFDYQVVSKSQVAKNKAEYLKANRQHLVDSLFMIQENAFNEQYNEWESHLAPSAKKAAQSLIIHKAYLGVPNSVAGCDYHLTFTNTGNKEIKYLNWVGSVYNAVNDKVLCEIKRTSTFSGQAVGPIRPRVTEEELWQAVIYNWSAETLKLTKIELIYMDGSKVSFNSEDIQAISNAPMKYMTIAEQNSIKRKITSTIDSEISQFERDGKYIENPSAARIGIGHYFDEELEIYNQFIEVIDEMRDYKERFSMEKWDAPSNVKALSHQTLYL